MRVFVIVFTVFFFAISGFAETLSGKIVDVADGDTATLLTSNNKQIRIRLNCIDAPEKSQDFGQRAKQSLISLIAGEYVEIKKHDVDRYGRTIGTIFLNGADINLIQVKKGLAWVYDRYCNDSDYYRAERQAKSSHLGLWSQPNPIEPWNYRRGKRNSTNRINSNPNCGDKRYCNQMDSCQEAIFYLTQCSVSTLDGDGDGDPCESLCR